MTTFWKSNGHVSGKYQQPISKIFDTLGNHLRPRFFIGLSPRKSQF